MKRVGSIILVALLLLTTMVGCGSKEEKAVTSFLDSMKKGDYDQASKYVYGVTPEEFAETFGESEDDPELTNLLMTVIKNFEYEIGETTEVDKEHANVNVSIESVDLGSVLEDVIAQLVSASLTGGDMSEEEIFTKMTELVEESLHDKEATTITTETTVALIKDDGDWKIDIISSPMLLDALLGNLFSLAGALGAFG